MEAAMHERFTVQATDTAPGEATIRMHGDIDVAADEALAAAYERGTKDGAARIVLDFAEVGYINSTGIALIVRLLAEARRDHRAVIAVGLSDHYQEIFRLTRLSDYLTILDPGPAPATQEVSPQ
jgi:anti-sigma B factor antagonist